MQAQQFQNITSSDPARDIEVMDVVLILNEALDAAAFNYASTLYDVDAQFEFRVDRARKILFKRLLKLLKTANRAKVYRLEQRHVAGFAGLRIHER